MKTRQQLINEGCFTTYKLAYKPSKSNMIELQVVTNVITLECKYVICVGRNKVYSCTDLNEALEVYNEN